MEIILIAAMTRNFVIGLNKTIPWHIPGEQTRFKETTLGHCLIMGRKTYESIGHPLVDRRNIIVTGNPQYQAPGCEIHTSLEQALKAAEQEEKVFIIGGQQLFEQSIGLADTLILTIIDQDVEGDTWFPRFSQSDFKLTHQEQVDAPVPYLINTYRKI